MKVLLVQPPIEDFYDTSIRTYPLALLYLAARLRGVADVEIADFRCNRKAIRLGSHPFPDLAPIYREGLKTPFSFFGAYYRFGDDEATMRDVIRKADPDVVCVSSLFTTYALEALEVARVAKEVKGEIVTVMGGIHPTLFPEHCLSAPFVDYVIRGEGERPLFELVKALGEGREPAVSSIGGLCRREGDHFRITAPHVEEDIDTLPARDLVSPDAYRIGRKNYSFFLTSRGCPFNCAFCGKPAAPYRKRSLLAMEREIGQCLGLGIGAIDFEDDMLNLDTRFFHETLALFGTTGLTLSAMNGIYTENLTQDTLERMYGAGFRRLNFALVDISRPVATSQKRPFPGHFLGLLPWLEDSPFLMEAHFIIGLPGQTPDEVIDTMIFLMGKRLLAGPSIFYLAPGSPVFGEMAGEDWVCRIKSLRASAMLPANPLMPREALFTFMKLTRFMNFVKSTLDRESGLTRLSELAGADAPFTNPVTREVVATLCRDGRFIAYDTRTRDFVEELTDRELVRRFFRMARGGAMRGFKTANTLTFDL